MSYCIRGYHVYGAIWSSTIGEILTCERDRHNTTDRYAVAVMKSGIVVGHLPRKISRMCSLFLRRGGNIHCIISGERRYSRDLPQGGLEIPCRIIFSGEPKEIKKLIKLTCKSNEMLVEDKMD